MQFFRKKSIEEIKEEAATSGLQKSLGAFDLVLLGVGAIVGVGIFVVTGVAAAKSAGPAIMVSFVIAAIICILTAFAYAELSSMVPVSGSAYTYAYIIFGEVVAWMVGWSVLMVFSIGGGSVAAGWSAYVVGVLADNGVHLPMMLTTIPADGGIINLPAFMIAVLLGLFLVRGTKETAKLNNILVGVKIITIALFVLIASQYFNFDHWENFTPFGWKGVGVASATIFFAYAGFEAVANAAEECHDPKRDLPIGIIGSVIVSAILYIVASGAVTAIVPFHTLGNAEPMAAALRANGAKMGSAVVAIGAFAAMTTVLLMQIYAQSRLLFVMARDGMLPKKFKQLHSKFDTPVLALVLSALVMGIGGGLAPIETVGKLTSMSVLTVFVVVSIGVLMMRIKEPDHVRPFRCPAVWLVAPTSILCSAYLIAELAAELALPYFICLGFGFVVYLVYGYHNSTLNDKENGSNGNGAPSVPLP